MAVGGFGAGVGSYSFVVVAGELGLAAVDLPAAGPLVDGVIGFDAVGTVEAGNRLAVLGEVVVDVEDDEGVKRGIGVVTLLFS